MTPAWAAGLESRGLTGNARGVTQETLSQGAPRGYVVSVSSMPFMHGLGLQDRLARPTRVALRRACGPRSDKGDGDPNQDPDPPAHPAA
jgi:hypothetical protein